MERSEQSADDSASVRVDRKVAHDPRLNSIEGALALALPANAQMFDTKLYRHRMIQAMSVYDERG